MTLIDDFMAVIRQIRNSAQNLSKDVDPNDKREETQEDLEQLSLNFQDLREIISSMNAEDQENISREFRELLSGQENFQTYTQDVKKILLDIKNRIKSDKKIEEKISENLPEEHQNETANSLFQGFGNLIEQISHWTDKAGRK